MNTIRVEEDLHLVDEVSRTLAPCADEVVERLGDTDRWAVDLDDCSLVATTSAHSGATALTQLIDEVRSNRLRVAQATAVVDSGDCVPLAAGVVPWPRSAAPVGSREHDIRTRYGQLGRQRITGGLRIIVDCDTDVLAVCRGISRHLPVLLAISASSPFDTSGEDTGYASSRLLGWRRWPTAGVFPQVDTMEEYRADIDFLHQTRVITGPAMMYYAVRPGPGTADDGQSGTVEIRLCDAASSVDTVGILAALGRALVTRESALAASGTPTAPLRPLQQRTATWRAARSGLEGELLDPESLRQRPAEDVVSSLIDLLHNHLGDGGVDAGRVRSNVEKLLRAGSGAYRQRQALRRRGRTDDIVGLLAAETLGNAGLEDAAGSTTLGLSAYEPGTSGEYGAEFWDESVDAAGEPRPESAPSLRTAVNMGTMRLRSRLQDSQEELTTRGVTFRASGTDQHLVFPIDPVPRIIDHTTWSTLAAGVEQRMLAINAFLNDIYGEREIVRAGVMDAATLERAPGFRRVGRHLPTGQVRNHISGADLVCSDGGQWQVLEDNVRMPSGLTFALAARDVTRTHFPELLGSTQDILGPIIDPQGSLETMCESLRMAATAVSVAPDEAHVVIATAGPSDSTYAEQAMLAKIGGFVLRNTDQLVVDIDEDASGAAAGKPALFDVVRGARRRVDVVYMRMEEEMFLSSTGADGEELRAPFQSVLSAGTVAVANALGNGVADDKAIYAYVPEMIDFYLGQTPLLDSVPTYLCSIREQRDQVLERLNELVVKPIDGYGGAGITVGPECTEEELEVRRRELLTHPDQFIAQEVVRLSTLPTFDGLGIQRRHVDLRMFSHLRQSDGPGSEVSALTVPAGLTRVAPAGSMIVNSSRGGGGKDTWILAD